MTTVNESVERRRFSVRHILAVVFVYAVFLGVSRAYSVGLAAIVILTAVMAWDFLLRRLLNKFRVGPSVGFVLRIALVPIPIACGIVSWWAVVGTEVWRGEYPQLVFAWTLVGAYALIVFAIPAACLGYLLIVEPGRPIQRFKLRTSRMELLAFVPTAVCLAAGVAIFFRHGIPDNGLTWLAVLGVLFWTMLFAVAFRWLASCAFGVFPALVMCSWLAPFLDRVLDHPTFGYCFRDYSLVDIRGGRVGTWYGPGLHFSKAGPNTGFLEKHVGPLGAFVADGQWT